MVLVDLEWNDLQALASMRVDKLSSVDKRLWDKLFSTDMINAIAVYPERQHARKLLHVKYTHNKLVKLQ